MVLTGALVLSMGAAAFAATPSKTVADEVKAVASVETTGFDRVEIKTEETEATVAQSAAVVQELAAAPAVMLLIVETGAGIKIGGLGQRQAVGDFQAPVVGIVETFRGGCGASVFHKLLIPLSALLALARRGEVHIQMVLCPAVLGRIVYERGSTAGSDR